MLIRHRRLEAYWREQVAMIVEMAAFIKPREARGGAGGERRIRGDPGFKIRIIHGSQLDVECVDFEFLTVCVSSSEIEQACNLVVSLFREPPDPEG